MKVILVKVSLLKSNTKLFSDVIHVQTRMHLNVLPLRCPYEDRSRSLKNECVAKENNRLLSIVNDSQRVAGAKYDWLLNAFNNLTHAGDARYNRLLSIMNDSQKVADAKYDRLLNAVQNLTNIVKRIGASKNVSRRRISGELFAIYRDTYCTIEYSLDINRTLDLWKERIPLS